MICVTVDFNLDINTYYLRATPKTTFLDMCNTGVDVLNTETSHHITRSRMRGIKMALQWLHQSIYRKENGLVRKTLIENKPNFLINEFCLRYSNALWIVYVWSTALINVWSRRIHSRFSRIGFKSHLWQLVELTKHRVVLDHVIFTSRRLANSLGKLR